MYRECLWPSETSRSGRRPCDLPKLCDSWFYFLLARKRKVQIDIKSSANSVGLGKWTDACVLIVTPNQQLIVVHIEGKLRKNPKSQLINILTHPHAQTQLQNGSLTSSAAVHFHNNHSEARQLQFQRERWVRNSNYLFVIEIYLNLNSWSHMLRNKTCD